MPGPESVTGMHCQTHPQCQPPCRIGTHWEWIRIEWEQVGLEKVIGEAMSRMFRLQDEKKQSV